MLRLSLWSGATLLTAGLAAPVSFNGDNLASGELSKVVQLSVACASTVEDQDTIVGTCKFNVEWICGITGENIRFYRPVVES